MTETTRQLRRTAAWRKAAEERARTYRRETYELIVSAYEQGATPTELAEASGLARQTIYIVLMRAGVEVGTAA